MKSNSPKESKKDRDRSLSLVPVQGMKDLSLDDIKVTVRGIPIGHEHWPDLLHYVCSFNALDEVLDDGHKSVGHYLRQNIPFYYRMNRNEEFDNFLFIGGGAFSRVYSAVHRLDGKTYALKVIRDISSPKSLKHAKIEVDVLAQLDHPNIVRYFSCWVEPQRIANLAFQPLDSRFCSTPSDPAESNRSSSAANFSWVSNVSAGDANCRLLRLVDDEDDSGSVGPRDSCALAIPENQIAQFSVSELNARPVTLVIQMELCGSTLIDWMQSRSKSLASSTASDCARPSSLDQSYRAEVRWIFDQIVKGIHYMHQKGVLHRDIKPANVFIQGPPLAVVTGTMCSAVGELACTSAQCFHRCRVKIGDFGLSTFLERSTESQTRPVIEEVPEKCESGPSTALQTIPSCHPRLLTGNLGTLFYTAPEVLKSNSKGRSLYNQKADMYSLGIVFFQMLYPCKTETEMARQIDHFHANPEAEDALPKCLTECWPLEANLLRRMLSPKPSDRPEAMEILSELASTSQVIDGTGLKDHQSLRGELSLINELRTKNEELEKENAELKRRLGFLAEPKE
uniref:non-specific serine/threonine protein kinase n=1 Tax=Echinococcus granulosus TaxID=6210 RepID=A0A068WUQ8_ECHGR|nr:eukaryotic translation initiation factor 2 alpha [Echinococcus granulosus]